MSKDISIKLITTTKAGRKIKSPVTIRFDKGRVWFVKSPFSLKDEIKAMKGSKWHGFQDPPKKMWSILECERNRFQLQWLMGKNPYVWWDQPLSELEYERPLRSYQELMSNHMLTYHYCIIAGEMGVGKFARLTTPVLTPQGWVTMGELKIGVRLIDPDGGTCRVLSLHPQGRKEIFKVTFTDGSFTECGAEHLWRVITPLCKWRGREYQVMELQELVARGLQDKAGNNKWFIPMVEPVDFDLRKLRCHPYVMGYLLGNGHLPQYKVSIPDQETIDRLNSFMLRPLKPTAGTLKGYKIDYIIQCPETRKAIDYYNLKACRSDTKFVPEDFLFNSVVNRLYLLQGLLDSDGTPLINSSGIEFCSASKDLAKSMVFLVQSFGGTCHTGLKEYPTYIYKDETRIGKPSYRINGSFWHHTKPFLLSRKAELYTTPTKYQPTRAIVSVESVGFDEAICIRVDSLSHCYVTDEFIVTHNTLSAIECIEKSGKKNWWWIGPKSGLKAVEREFHKWGLDSNINLTVMTYEKLRNVMTHDWTKDTIPPDGVFFDESSRLKNSGAKRTIAAQLLADAIRDAYGKDGYVVLMSGTPSPKSPVDWWAQAEIAWPGFLREGDARAFERRMGVFVEKSDGVHKFLERTTWLDDEEKCRHCGGYANEEQHDLTLCAEDMHEFESSFNEIGYLYDRLKGLVLVLHKKDCVDLPDKQYRQIVCEPTPTIQRVARALVKVAPNVITGLTWLRELSDGFQYQDKVDGTKPCPVCEDGTVEIWTDPDDSERKFEMIDMLDSEYITTLKKQRVQCSCCKGKQEVPKTVRTVKEVPCPKDDIIKQLLDENEEQGRLVIFAGFTGSLDRITNLCLKEHWAVVRVDGRGWYTFDHEGNNVTKQYEPLDYWADVERFPRVAFVAHPKSGGLSLTLTEARMVVYFSNDFNPESRSHSEDRIHRLGMDENKGATIVDIIHLPTDARVLSILRDNRRLELITLGDIKKSLGVEREE